MPTQARGALRKCLTINGVTGGKQSHGEIISVLDNLTFRSTAKTSDSPAA